MTNLTNKVLDELRDKDVRPVPAWRFVLRSALAWIGFVMFVLFGAQAVSIILFLLMDHDWTELAQFRGGRVGYFFLAVPYLWMLALIALVVVAYLDFKKTKSGYRYRPLVVVGVVIAISSLAGVGLHAIGMGKRADAALEGRLPMYRQMAPRGLQLWNNPEQGRLIGEIERIDDDGTVTLRSPNGESWTVNISPELVEQAQLRLEEGNPIRVMGQPVPDGGFRARVILPWKQGRGSDPDMRLHMRDGNREEMLQRARSTDERSMRPPVHPVAQPIIQPIN